MNENSVGPIPAAAGRSPLKKWRRRAFVTLAMFALLAGILFEASSHVVRGWLRGEAFYDGRPTSWWRKELGRWEPVGDGFHRPETWMEDQIRNWSPDDRDPMVRMENLLVSDHSPTILYDKDALLVLRELLADESPVIQRFAQIGLGIEPNDRFENYRVWEEFRNRNK